MIREDLKREVERTHRYRPPAPDIQKALLTGTAPPHIDAELLLKRDLPLDWLELRRYLGLAP